LKDKAIGYLARCLKGLNRLESLKINISYCDKLTNKAIGVLSKSLISLKNLKSVCLTGACIKINAEGLRLFSENLQKVKGLKKLSLDLRENREIQNKGFEYLGQNIAKMSHLESLELCFMECDYMTLEKCIPNLGKSLSQLKSLVNLYINFANCDHTRDRIDFSGFFRKPDENFELKECINSFEKNDK